MCDAASVAVVQVGVEVETVEHPCGYSLNCVARCIDGAGVPVGFLVSAVAPIVHLAQQRSAVGSAFGLVGGERLGAEPAGVAVDALALR